MKVALTVTLLSSLAVQQAAAQYGWGNAKPFSNPYNTDNKCSKDQQSGFGWGGLKTGNFGQFGGFDFSGFSCKDSFSKRPLSKRTGFQDKCIEGSVSKSDGGPNISCGSGDQFSINEMQVSVSYDTDLNFIYDMPDGSTCKHTSQCSASGSTVQNTQCGGAKSVTFQLPQHSDKDDCDIGIHSIIFDCSAGTTSTVSETSSTVAATSIATSTESVAGNSSVAGIMTTTPASDLSASLTSSTPTETASPTDTGVLLTTSTVFSTSTATVTSCGPEVKSCPARSTVVVTSVIAVSTTVCPVSQVTQTGGASASSSTALPADTSSAAVSTTATASSTSETSSTAAETSTTTAPESSAAVTTAPPAPESSAPPAGFITTEIVYTSVTTCPVLATLTTGGSTLVQSTSTISTLTLTSTATVCPSCTASPLPPPSPESTAAASPPASSSPPPPPPAGCPQVLPSCLNSFLSQYVPSCSSNSDASCFCPSSGFTNAVMQCIQSWGVSQQEVQAAMSYFTGICANHVGQNPGIITAVPSTITLIPTPSTETVTATAAGSAPPPPPASIPVTTVSIESTITISSTLTSVYTTAVTVPQVQFITTATPAPPGETNAAAPTAVGSVVIQTTQVGLIPGTTYAPAEASAGVTPAAASTFGTSIVPAPTEAGNSTAAATSSSPFAAFTGAASKHNVGKGIAGVAMVAMAIAL